MSKIKLSVVFAKFGRAFLNGRAKTVKGQGQSCQFEVLIRYWQSQSQGLNLRALKRLRKAEDGRARHAHFLKNLNPVFARFF